jgi:16S rRNA (cytidine1402-2'-O)-methyltransferase
MAASSRPGPAPNALTPGLYLVSTPIGNLRDITLRALDVLAGVDIVLAEDTRVSGRLLAAHGLSARMERYDEHGAARVRPRILAALLTGAKIALVSDAGTPLVSDPGYRLVREALAQGSAVHPIPGPSAVMAALAVAGLPTDRFLFAGFPPPRSAARRSFFQSLVLVRATLILFESGPRLSASLADMAAALGPREAAVARELTKLHETVIRGRLDDLARDPALNAPRGEIVVLVAPAPEEQATPEQAKAALVEALSRAGPAEAASEVAKALGLPRRALYTQALELLGR